ncbi:cation:proton antiporter [Halobacterium zhouii]|uniref:cation:proton antiporter n=1 Tax=Halobacterium zhouii TaxID=2902624 RepID=UPI001E629A8B|nr:cation:proton antiporter [Halobacterium zhouii]
MANGIEAQLIDLVAVFLLAGGVGVFVAKVGRFPYTIALLLAGLGVSVAGIDLGIELSHDVILFVILPPLLFEGAADTEMEQFRRNLPIILTLAVVGLLGSTVVLAALARPILGFPITVALLFAAMILPTDPVSVLALFDELGAPDRLSVLVEGESLINDGVGVVVFIAVLDLTLTVANGERTAAGVLDPSSLATVGGGILVSALGGAVVGLLAGYAIYRVMATLDEHMTETVLALILAYGSFLLAEHYVHVSGVIAVVAAGLLIGNRGAEEAMSPQTKITVFNTLETGAFIANTFVFLTIGVQTPIGQLLRYADLILLAVPLVLFARATTLYPLVAVYNRAATHNYVDSQPIPWTYQHVMLWGGLHASIPIALVIGLPPGTPFREQLRALVFGVAAFSLVVQGLTMSNLLDRLGVVTQSDAKRLYELLVGRRRAVDDALDAAERLYRRGEIPGTVHRAFTDEYEDERDTLSDAIEELLAENPELRREQLLIAERRILKREKSAVMDAMRNGVVGDEAGEALLDEVNLKLDTVQNGDSTVETGEEGYREFWRNQAAEFGLDAVDEQTEG